MAGDAESGGEPQAVGRCTACGEVYPLQETTEGTMRPIGIDGTCRCGNDEFVSIREE